MEQSGDRVIGQSGDRVIWRSGDASIRRVINRVTAAPINGRILTALCCNEENQPQAAGFFYYQDSFLLGSAMNSVAGVPGVAAPIFVMPNLRAFSLLQRLPIFFSARCAGLPVAIIVTRNGTFTRRLIVGTCLAELAARQSAGHPVCMPRWHAPCVAGYRCGLSGAEAGP